MRLFRITTTRWILIALIGACCGCASGQSAGEFVFTVFGDSRPGAKVAYSPVLAAVVTDMARHRPLFVLGTGDYIEGAKSEATLREQWHGFFLGIEPLQSAGRVPVALAPGNHDILGSRRYQAIFEEYFKRRYWSFTRNGCHFIVLDTEEPGKAGRIAGEQLDWLKNDLKKNRGAALTFVVVHRPLYPVGVHKGDSLDSRPDERDALQKLFVKEGVDCVFAGHEHQFSRQVRDGVEHYITGGAGAPLYAKSEKGGFYHYLLVTVRGGQYHIDIRKFK